MMDKELKDILEAVSRTLAGMTCRSMSSAVDQAIRLIESKNKHSFTVDGHTFYADNKVDILYLERKFGVGGKDKLEVVKDE